MLSKVFLKAIQTIRTLPKEVRVRKHKLKDSLAPLMESFGVTVRVVSRLPASDEARSHLLGFFGGGFGGREDLSVSLYGNGSDAVHQIDSNMDDVLVGLFRRDRLQPVLTHCYDPGKQFFLCVVVDIL